MGLDQNDCSDESKPIFTSKIDPQTRLTRLKCYVKFNQRLRTPLICWVLTQCKSKPNGIIMKFGIIGSGDIGGNLGLHLAKAGHRVMFSSRHPQQLEGLAEKGGENASVGTIKEAAKFGDAIILAIPFWAVEEVAKKVGSLEGKMIVETTNPYPDRDGEMAKKVRDSNRPSSEFVAEHFPEAHVLKAFNTIYYKHLRDQAFRDQNPRAIPYAGNHENSLRKLKNLIEEIGFAPVYVGKLSESHPMDVDQELYNKDITAKKAEQILENS